MLSLFVDLSVLRFFLGMIIVSRNDEELIKRDLTFKFAI